MKHYKNVTVPAHETRKYVETTCDICNQIIATGPFEVNQVELSHEIGESYPGCYMTETFAPDICGDCFTGIIKPFFDSLGITAEYKDND